MTRSPQRVSSAQGTPIVQGGLASGSMKRGDGVEEDLTSGLRGGVKTVTSGEGQIAL
jgi:hypothetical protein